ncbi:MAG: hypothetical protein K5648_00400 [Erysipelotrichaceae bacterium]|nr:hypothetical protein [Erysipelotrichaceae bacterium]
MEKRSQCYLGIPNAVVLCVDRMDPVMAGRYFHHYHEEAIGFEGLTDLLLQLEDFYDDLRFPFPGNNERHFFEKEVTYMEKEMTRKLEDDEMLEMHGDLGTFIIRVQHRQNSSWQGRITWVEQDKTLYFRSVWEMVKLIEEAMDDHKEEVADDPSWKE